MTETALPKQEHIDFLIENPRTAALFDGKYGEGASTKYLPTVETTPQEKEDKPAVSGITANSLIGIKEGIRGTLETLEGLSDLAEEKIMDDALIEDYSDDASVIEETPSNEKVTNEESSINKN